MGDKIIFEHQLKNKSKSYSKEKQPSLKIQKWKMNLNNYHRRILQVLCSHDYPLTIGQISRETGFSWNTVYKYIEIFCDEGWVKIISNKYYQPIIEK